ncbi:MAG: large ribosomal subunit protein bL35 [Dehalococcoidia bacterium]
MAKLKLKTHSGVKRRFSMSGRGRILRRKSHVNNARRKKRQSVKREFNTKRAVHASFRQRLRRLLPYGEA